MEQVSKEMMDELASTESFDEILEYVYHGSGNTMSALDEYIAENNYSDSTYLKIIQHLNGEPQFEAEKPKKWTNPQTEVVEVEE